MARYKKLISLAKELDFKTEEEYFDYMIVSSLNGQNQQCINLMNAMCWKDRVKSLAYIIETNYKGVFMFYTNYLTK